MRVSPVRNRMQPHRSQMTENSCGPNMRFGELQGSTQPTTVQKRLGLYLLVEYAVRSGHPKGTVDQLVLKQCE